jgi:hypothetical protein
MAINRRFSSFIPSLLVALVGIIIAFLSSSCSKEKIDGQGKFLLPWPNAQGEYELQVIEIRSLKEPSSLTGDAARIMVDPRVSSDGLHGDRPSAHFRITNEGVHIPEDVMSGQFAAIYAHEERLWDMDQALGIDNLLERPRKVGIKIRSGGNVTGGSINNAVYTAQHDAVVLMPYDPSGNPDLKQLALGLNGGILAHEHFHGIFAANLIPLILKSVNLNCNFAQPLAKVDSFISLLFPQSVPIDLNNETIIAGFNEGLADLWGWIYTGDDDFIAHSLPNLKAARTLKLNSFVQDVLTTNEFVKEIQATNASSKENLPRLPYKLGTMIARQLKIKAYQHAKLEPSDAMNFEDRLKVAKVLLKMLPEIGSTLSTNIQAQTAVSTELPAELFDKMVAADTP